MPAASNRESGRLVYYVCYSQVGMHVLRASFRMRRLMWEPQRRVPKGETSCPNKIHRSEGVELYGASYETLCLKGEDL
jgi:hypothetical protein